MPDHSEQAVIMADRKEHHDMINRQKHRHHAWGYSMKVVTNRSRALNERGPEPENSRNLPNGFSTAWLQKAG